MYDIVLELEELVSKDLVIKSNAEHRIYDIVLELGELVS